MRIVIIEGMGTLTAEDVVLDRTSGPATQWLTPAEMKRIVATSAFARNQSKATVGPYTTQLSATQETAFRRWLKEVPDLAEETDFHPDDPFPAFDLRGHWANGADVGSLENWMTPYSLEFGSKSRYWARQEK